MADLSLDFGTGRSVVGGPGRILLALAGFGKGLFIRSHFDRASSRGLGALGAERAINTSLSEAGEPSASLMATDGNRDPGWTSHGVRLQIDLELTLREQIVSIVRKLGLAA